MHSVFEPTVAARLLRNRLECVRSACNQADHESIQRLRATLGDLDIAPILHGLLDTLKEAVLIVGSSAGIGMAVGAGVGAFFGGVGAIPGGALGAAVGTKVGLWILAALGLKSLAEDFIDGLPRILENYHTGFTRAWQAGKDPVGDRFMHGQSIQITVAASHIANGHVAIVLLLLSAITAYLLRGKKMQTLAQEARTGRLGDRFATWMAQNEEKLRTHPKLQPVQNSRSNIVPGSPAGGGNLTPPKKTHPVAPAPRPRGMPPTRVPCFKTKNLPQSKVPEFDRQLAGQERGINDLSVDEYLKGRELYSTARDPKVARQARIKHKKKMTRDLSHKLQADGLNPKMAEKQAAEMAAEKIKTLAALHNPDLVAGGKDVIGDFGDRDVNSRIGAQWKSRVGELDEAVKKIPEADRGKVKVNAKLDRCK